MEITRALRRLSHRRELYAQDQHATLQNLAIRCALSMKLAPAPKTNKQTKTARAVI